GVGGAVVVVAGVGGEPVVAADRADGRAFGRLVGGVGAHRDRVFGQRRAFALGVRIELPGDRAFGAAERARDRRLVLEDRADGARGGVLGGCDRRRSGGHFDGLIRAFAFRGRVVRVAAICRHPPVF